jgi:iron-sulfur cluster assembly protein
MTENITENMTAAEITVTPEAAAEIRRVRTENNIPESLSLRLGVKDGSGCCGVSYLIGFDDKASETDRVFQSEGLTVFVDLQSLLRLSGSKLAFAEGPEGRGFYFDNPGEEKCGCGGGCDCGN